LARAAADLDWLRTHGLLARTVAPSALEGGDAVHRLLASRRQGALAAREGEAAARAWHLRIAEHLEERPGPPSDLGAAARHREAAGDRQGALRSYYRWAVGLRDRHAYRACVQIAREGLAAFPAGEGEAERAAAASLWLSVHDGLAPLGAVKGAREAIEKALELTAGATGPEALFASASAQLQRGRDLVRAGSIQEARSALEQAAVAFGKGGYARDRAIALGEVASLLQARGQLDEALRIRREEQLPVYEALGDVRSLLVARTNLALNLRARSRPADVEEADGLLKLALAAAEALRIPEAQTIRGILAQATPGMPAKPGFLRRLCDRLGRRKVSS
jgi:tetratricopeptide (TPR) repeat protein